MGERQFAGPAGTVLVFHQGLWHAGVPNPSDRHRWMYKIRLNPKVPQLRLWNTDDLDAVHNGPDDHTFAHMRLDSVAQVLRAMQPWQQGHEARYELLQRAKLWRHLTGDAGYDVDLLLDAHGVARPRRARGRRTRLIRQQVLQLWTAEGALDTGVVGWAFHDGSRGRGPSLPDGDPPYRTGLAALEDGWMLIQTPQVAPLAPGAEHEVSYLSYEFVFERRIELSEDPA